MYGARFTLVAQGVGAQGGSSSEPARGSRARSGAGMSESEALTEREGRSLRCVAHGQPRRALRVWGRGKGGAPAGCQKSIWHLAERVSSVAGRAVGGGRRGVGARTSCKGRFCRAAPAVARARAARRPAG